MPSSVGARIPAYLRPPSRSRCPPLHRACRPIEAMRVLAGRFRLPFRLKALMEDRASRHLRIRSGRQNREARNPRMERTSRVFGVIAVFFLLSVCFLMFLAYLSQRWRMEVGAFRREPSVVAHGLRAGFFLKFSWQLRKNEPRPFIVCGEGFRAKRRTRFVRFTRRGVRHEETDRSGLRVLLGCLPCGLRGLSRGRSRLESRGRRARIARSTYPRQASTSQTLRPLTA